MEFLIGICIIIFLIPIFFFVSYIMKLLPPEFTLGSLFFMIALDGIISYAYYMALIDILDNNVIFKKGIGIGFGLATMIRVAILMIKSKNIFIKK